MMRSQTLLIDADDTLWENNIYFERAIAAFYELVGASCANTIDIRLVLNQCEHENIAVHGYGMATFGRSLLDCWSKLSGQPATAEQRASVDRLVHSIAGQAIQLLPGVAEALPALAARHRLILVTKGNPSEQQEKLDRSGIHAHFAAIEIPAEKHQEVYRDILSRYQLVADNTWMIGNSPRSDINPALAAGLHAVYVHHPNTWVLEHEAMRTPAPPQQLLHMENFAQLTAHF